ncbi:MAG: hypothetical protein ABJO88_03020 [Parasphingorhabdus sp.]
MDSTILKPGNSIFNEFFSPTNVRFQDEAEPEVKSEIGAQRPLTGKLHSILRL